MKKLLFSTLALAAVVVASPVLANDFNMGSQDDPETVNVPNSPVAPDPLPSAEEGSIDMKDTKGFVVNNKADAAGKPGDVVGVEIDGVAYWKVFRENGYDLIPVAEEDIITYEEESSSSSSSSKSEEKAVKNAVAAAKKDAAKKDAAKPAAKDGKKVLPNTSAVK